MSTFNLVLLSAAAAPFVFASWAAYLRWQHPLVEDARDIATETGVTRTRFEAETLDLSAMLRTVADSLESLARTRFARILLAVNPGYMVRADRNALHMTLCETIATAVRATPGGQVLISVRPLGTQLHILVTDDGADADQRLRESMVRGAGDLIALQGGAIAIEARPGTGTTVTLRLPLFTGSSATTAMARGPSSSGSSVFPVPSTVIAGFPVSAGKSLSNSGLVLVS